MKYIKMQLKSIKPYENNPRNNEDAVLDVMESIKQCSYISPIIIDENGVILAGHTRYEALNNLGYSECSVIVAEDLTEEQKKKYRLYDNKTGELATWDNSKLIKELCNVDFEGYNFGQPVEKERKQKSEIDNKQIICPCCGEVFES